MYVQTLEDVELIWWWLWRLLIYIPYVFHLTGLSRNPAAWRGPAGTIVWNPHRSQDGTKGNDVKFISFIMLKVSFSWKLLSHSVVFTCYVWFQHYRDLTLVSRDGLTIVLTKTNQIIFEKWLKLLDSTRAQVGNVKRFKYFFMLICLIDMWWINECYLFYRLFGCARNWYKMEFLDLIVFVTAL